MATLALDHTNIMDRFYSHEHPELGAGPIPVEPFISKDYFDKEIDLIFKQHWLKVCQEVEIPNPGDYLIKDIAFLKMSLIIVRGNDGVVRAFHNVCQHRGNKLVCVGHQGKAASFVCHFHGWAYALDGSLRGVPEQDRFLNFDKAAHNLPPVTMDIWNGWVFIHAQDKPAQSLRDQLDGFGRDLDPYPFDEMRLLSSYKARLKTNWKVGVNAFQESYHVPTVHGKNRSVSLPTSPAFTPSPIEQFSGSLTNGQSQAGISRQDKITYPGINPFGVPNFGFDINVVFPNTFIDTGEGYYFTYEFWPITVDETDFVMKLYMPPAKSWSVRIAQELTIIQLRDVVREDLSTLESTQAGMMSGGIKQIVLSDQELNVRHQHKVVDAIVRG
jgi:phenylpropionate dioxygenase-like ring-hydroxylating dioxygenase large terminal subunit